MNNFSLNQFYNFLDSILIFILFMSLRLFFNNFNWMVKVYTIFSLNVITI